MPEHTPWIGVGSRTCERALVEAFTAIEGVAHEWPWEFHGGRSRTVITPQGSTAGLCSQTVFGHVVVSVDDGRTDLVAMLDAACPLQTPTELTARFLDASSPGDRADALLGLASAAAIHREVTVPKLEQCVALALDSDEPWLRLIALRAISMMPAATAHRLLADREDPANPGLEEWRDHYAEQFADSAPNSSP
ncbi:hypothetical protein BM536_036885 [Streptomyces phaeoluteigriseus]|uniref:Uncharacterized protein n=1 Tax=Streptomyces phaeoluteigriseus TaxID=114686 RepID=A0A1V6MHS1_9ACTN|nr:hypothetical protein [Streptomyces phaeoluteigriseus]OQD52014.1 hypothetical protein BM536_036885 [Streptomyces phaeoluteigriseus]